MFQTKVVEKIKTDVQNRRKLTSVIGAHLVKLSSKMDAL